MSGGGEWTIRLATPQDIPELERIFAAARRWMVQNGNPNQWAVGYPGRSVLEYEIGRKVCHVVEQDGKPVGTFCAILGGDPTYAEIYDGEWPDDEPYLTIHRVASDGTARGVAGTIFAYCAKQGLNLRIDTHADNRIMQGVLARNGFVKCGTIYLENGSPRWAYQRNK